MKKIIQISDTHLFPSENTALTWMEATPVFSNKSFCRVLAHVMEHESSIDHLIFSGDIAEVETRETYQYFNKKINALGIPYTVLPGNHDDNNLLFEVVTNNHSQNSDHFLLGNWQVILLDSTVTQQPYGQLTAHQLKRLHLLLEKKPTKPTMIVMHHHPIAINSPWIDEAMVLNGHEFVNLIEPYQHIKAVVFGHIHQAFDQTINNIRFLGTPSTCIQFQAQQNEARPNSTKPYYRVIELHDNGSLTTHVGSLT